MIIYQVTNIVNGKRYIGKTSQSLHRRSIHHFSKSKSGSETLFHRAIRKYGKDSFVSEILETVTDENLLNEREIHWINILSPEYNLTKGGDGGDTSQSENFKSAMKKYHSSKSRSSYATYGMLGKKQSDDQKKMISERNSYPVSCLGIVYPSIKSAQEAFPGISIRKRIDSKHHPDFFRVRPKRSFITP